eukprot:CAMPEP_0204913386 /NCGR_PEP_ID=MMETSP1397-20131031/11276_1 /ASSEMBLY_ACC=CAM_ASM_000891 /TAXON_ID=49980 /ORGANISM="Climacostomum Climacostomum virens, Strain Stock W-24" /LENGTH=250 /DNA_ID=CAMNT_0052084607 /DNA_START=94 /DNA_END=846 /DNA_ORIENTATION=+
MILFKLAFSLLRASFFFQSDTYYWEIFNSFSFGVYNTATYATMLLLSNGISITRSLPNKAEGISLGFHLMFVFIAFSMFLVFNEAAYVVVAVINFSFFKAVRFTKGVREALMDRLAELRQDTALMALVVIKLIKMKKCAVTVSLYFSVQLFVYLGLFIVAPLFLVADESYMDYVLCYLQFSEVICVSLTCCWFRAKPRTVAVLYPFLEEEPFVMPVLYKALENTEVSEGPIVIVPPSDQPFSVALPVKKN